VDAAFRQAERNLSERLLSPPPLFYPEMRGVQRDPRFWPLAASYGLVDYWLTSGRWPDFCFEPDLPFDCREKAEAAREELKAADPQARSP